MPYDLVPDQFPTLQGDGLTLRELTEEDLPAWFARLSDAEAAALAGDPVPTSEEDVMEGLRQHRNAFRGKQGLRWAIVPDSLGTSVGTIGFDPLSQDERSAGIGAAIGRAHWGRGVATGAGRLVLDYGFSALRLERVWAVVLPENARVIRVLQKLGFASGRDSETIDRSIGNRTDTLLYDLHRDSWGANVNQVAG